MISVLTFVVNWCYIDTTNLFVGVKLLRHPRSTFDGKSGGGKNAKSSYVTFFGSRAPSALCNWWRNVKWRNAGHEGWVDRINTPSEASTILHWKGVLASTVFERNFFTYPYLISTRLHSGQKKDNNLFLLEHYWKPSPWSSIFVHFLLRKSRRNASKMESQVRQNYHRDCEAAVNRMVNMELFASYTYTSMVRKTKKYFCLYVTSELILN